MWECSECEFENDLDPGAEEGQLVECVECGAEFEIVSMDPLDVSLMDLESDSDDDEEEEEEEEVESDADGVTVEADSDGDGDDQEDEEDWDR